MSRMGTTLSRMDTSNIAERITQQVVAAMKERGISQREMSRKAGIPLNTLSARLQQNTTRPFNLGELALVANVLNISIVELALRAERQPLAA